LKPSSQFIWQLIQSMSTSEKLFFKRNFSAAGTSQQRLYLKLFDAIAAQKEYNEEAIVKKFHPLLHKKNIAFQKHYLQKQICDALIQYNNKDDNNQEIYNQIMLIQVYRKKGLLNEAQALWRKALQKARQSESHSLINMLRAEFEKMILMSGLHIRHEEMLSIFKNNFIAYSEVVDVVTLRDIYAETILIKRKAHFDIDIEVLAKVRRLLKQVNGFAVPDGHQSFWYTHYYLITKATLLYLAGDSTNSFVLLQDLWKDWKKNPHHLNTHGEYFIELLYMINYAGILNKSYKYVMDVMTDKINDSIKEPAQKANYEAIRFISINKIYNRLGKYDDVKKIISQMKAKCAGWEPLLNADINRTACLSAGIAYFILDEYDDAIYFVKRAVSYFKDGVREEHFAVAQILLLLITYCLNNSRLFEAQYKTTYTYFHKRQKTRPFEIALVQCLHKTFYKNDRESQNQEFQKTLLAYEQHKDSRVAQMTFNIFNYPGWVVSKVQNIPYRQFVQRKIKAEQAEAEMIS
jgi:hypothetical protein